MSLTAECLERLSLKDQPFAPNSRDAFLYKDALLDSQIERMLGALEKPGAILLLSASSGAGRSIQLMRLLSTLPKHFEIIAFLGRNNTSFASVEVTIRKHLKARGDDDPNRPLNDILVARGTRGIDTLIAVDDAHLLGSEILRQLLKLGEDARSANSRGPRLLLVGDAVLGRNYPRILIPNDQRRVQHISLAPFNQEQTAAYLRHRLGAAGHAELAALFKPDVITNFHKRSRGLPRELNVIAEEWLSDYCQTPDHKDKIAAAAAAAEEAPEAPPEATDHPVDTSADEDISAPPQEAPPEGSESPEEPPATESEMAPASKEAPAQQPDSETEQQHQKQKAAIPFWKRPWFMLIVAGIALGLVILGIALNLSDSTLSLAQLSLSGTASEKKPDDAAPEQAPASNAPDLSEAQENGTPEAEQSTEQSTEELTEQPTEGLTDAEVAPAGDSEEAEADGAAADGAQASASEPAPPAASARPPQVPPPQKPPSNPDSAKQPAKDATPDAPVVYDKAHTRADLSWLAEQDPNHLTIQLIALQKVAAVEDYINTHQLEGANIIPTRSIVVAVFGSFPDMASTMAALAMIPQDMLAQGYWIRTIGDIQADVR